MNDARRSIMRGVEHLSGDPLLKGLIDTYPLPDIGRGGDPFLALCRAIIFQQLSGKAAGTIYKRFSAMFPCEKPTPASILKLQESDFRNVGVSGQKSSYLRGLATAVVEKRLVCGEFHSMSDEEIRAKVTAVKGIGIWTADMFLIFTLGRLDVLPTLDLGIKRGFQRLFQLKEIPDDAEMQRRAASWRPYRSIASWYLWRVSDEGNPHRPS